MSERIDHTEEARNFLGAATIDTYGDDDRKVAIAQVHATLAFVEQQRIANLIALGEQWEPSVCFVCDINPCDRDGHEEHYGPDELLPEIREALGL